MDTPYRYRLRPGYGSDKWLLEFFLDSADGEFENTLFTALHVLNPSLEEIQDLWMNNEILMSVCCDQGSFLLSKDIWGFAFIMADDNQQCVLAIEEILSKNDHFRKEEVDHALYTIND